MTVGIEMGTTAVGAPALLDLEELLATRLLVQGNSGSGKSHLLRRLIEQSAPWVQQAVIDPEGDFVLLAEEFGHVVVDAAAHGEAALQQIAGRVREHRVSVVLNLEHLDAEMQMRHAAAFLGGLFDVARPLWFPMLVVVDEAQLFAPAVAGEVSDEARKASLGAMTNLMCRGRKRGLAGVIATQRLAKLAKNVAAEASNFLMGRTFLDIDMARAADLLGMERRQAEMFRDLGRGHFIALGPALARRPLSLTIGGVRTTGRAGSPTLMPLPETAPAEARDLIMTPGAHETPRMPPPRRPTASASAELMRDLAHAGPGGPSGPPSSPVRPAEAVDPTEAVFNQVLGQVLADPETAFRSVAVLYQEFLVGCRNRGFSGRRLDLAAFRRRLAAARAPTADGPEWALATAAADQLPEDIRPVFLLLARAALDQAPCPSDSEIARARGSRSPRRARGVLSHMEQTGVIVSDERRDGTRVISLPGLGWRTAPGGTADEEPLSA